jgi:hypothetical protein
MISLISLFVKLYIFSFLYKYRHHTVSILWPRVNVSLPRLSYLVVMHTSMSGHEINKKFRISLSLPNWLVMVSESVTFGRYIQSFYFPPTGLIRYQSWLVLVPDWHCDLRIKKYLYCHKCDGNGSVRPNYTFALGLFALKVGPFALIIKSIINFQKLIFFL